MGIMVAQTISKQVGSDAWFATSAREPRWWTKDNGDTVWAVRFGNRYGLQNWFEVTYRRSTDDYAVSAYKLKRNGTKVSLLRYEGVYWDRLGDLLREANEESQS